MKLVLSATLVAISVLCTQVEAGLFSMGQSSCGENSTRCCEPEYKSVKVKKKCWKTECEEVAFPPVCIPSCGDIFRNMCPRKGNCGSGSCGQGNCCELGCSSAGLPRTVSGTGLLAKLFGKHAKCRVRVVNKLKSDSYESEKTKVEWKVQHRCGDAGGCCGAIGCGDHCTSQ